jgi:hypothetical protein
MADGRVDHDGLATDSWISMVSQVSRIA